ncbi:MAG: hypothetical protein KGQ83_00960 [Planctomycetes bacterium]|nr:hypothetical protein [Planctomycetota bacterium]
MPHISRRSLECVRILREIDEKEVFAHDLITARCSQGDLPKRDKHLLAELVNGVIRHRLSLDTLISFFSKIPFNCFCRSKHIRGTGKKFISNEFQFCLNAEEYYLPSMNRGDGGYTARLRRRQS